MIRDLQAAAVVHGIFEYGAIVLGLLLYRRRGHIAPAPLSGNTGFPLAVGLVAGAGTGNKLVFLIERPDVWHQWLDGHWVLPGQSIVGGLLGGLIGLEIAKVIAARPTSTGDRMIVPIAMGLGIGRVGCFLAGLHDDTYGLPSMQPWAIDMGDGLRRHPTALYEIAFLMAWCATLKTLARHHPFAPGALFKCFLSGYLLWRIFVDTLKPVPHAYAFGLSGIQWVCIAGLLVYLPFVVRALRAAPAAGLSSV